MTVDNGVDVGNERVRELLKSDAIALGLFYRPTAAPPLGRLNERIKISNDLQAWTESILRSVIALAGVEGFRVCMSIRRAIRRNDPPENQLQIALAGRMFAYTLSTL